MRRLLVAMMLLAVPGVAQRPGGETLLEDGHIYIEESAEGSGKFAAAMLVRGDRIVAVGDPEKLERLASADARRVDLHGRTVLPGLIDTHTHALAWALSKVSGELDLHDVKSVAEVQAQVRARARALRPGEWIRGIGWDDAGFSPNGGRLTRRELDAAAGSHPLFLEQVTGHLAVVNSAALRRAGIGSKTADPGGGVIERDAQGEPNGVLKDGAMQLVEQLLPPPNKKQWLDAVRYVSKSCVQVGLTSIHDVALSPAAIITYREGLRAGVLQVRVSMAPLVASEADADALVASGEHTGDGNPWLKLGAAKFFADGGMAAHTAAVVAPGPAGDERNLGLLLWQPADLQRLQLKLARAGWQLSTHAIGDRAIAEVLDSYAQIAAALPPRDLRNRVIHAGLTSPVLLERMAAEQVYVDNNPPFVYFMSRNFTQYGAERQSWMYRGESYFAHGIVASGGSDVSVTPLSPWWGIWAAVTRTQLDGTVLTPKERLTVAEALREYTVNGARAGFDEQSKGLLAAGKLADFIVIDRDIFARPVDELKDVKVLSTWVGGAERFHRE